jgi:hypothetical protein
VPIKNLARGDRVSAQVSPIAEKKIFFQSFVVKKKKLGENISDILSSQRIRFACE